jgi:hypothetical protein
MINSRNPNKQSNAYCPDTNKIKLSSKYNENKVHATSVSNDKTAKRMKKLVYFGEQTTKNRIKPQIKTTCDSVRKSQKRGTKSRYYDKISTSKMSEARKPSSKNKKKKSFNNTTKLSSHFVTPM